MDMQKEAKATIALEEEYKENFYALLIAICTDRTAEEALREMGL